MAIYSPPVSPTPLQPPVANSNPTIPEDWNFWSCYDLHAPRILGSDGHLVISLGQEGHPAMIKSAILGDTNFWLRSTGDPYITNFDALATGYGEESDFTRTPEVLNPYNQVDCQTCFESSGTVDSSFLDNFKQSKPSDKTGGYPLSESYDYYNFFYSSSRIESYENRIPLTDGSDVLVNDRIVYLNGIHSRLIMGSIANDTNDFGIAQYGNGTFRGHYNYYRFSGSVRPNNITANPLMMDPMHSTNTGMYEEVNINNYTGWPNLKVISPNFQYDYLGAGFNEGIAANVASNLIPQNLYGSTIYSFASQSQTSASFWNRGLSTQPGYAGSSGSYLNISGFEQKFFHSIWYIEDTASFNRLFTRTDAFGTYSGVWPAAPLYFMTSSSVTTINNGDWMPEGLRTKAESLALALNFYGQFWGPPDTSQDLSQTSSLDYFDGSGLQGEHFERNGWARAPYSWSTDANDNLIYTSSLCSGSRIDHIHTGYLSYIVGHEEGTPRPLPFWQSTGSEAIWATNPMNSGSVNWRGARGYVTYSGENYQNKFLQNNFSESVNGIRFDHHKGHRYDWNHWKVIGDTNITASFVTTKSRGGIAPSVMYTGIESSSADNMLQSFGFITGALSGSTGPEYLGLRFEKEWNQGNMRAAGKPPSGYTEYGKQSIYQYTPWIITSGNASHSLTNVLTMDYLNAYFDTTSFSYTLDGYLSLTGMYKVFAMYNGEACMGGTDGNQYGLADTHTGHSPEGIQAQAQAASAVPDLQHQFVGLRQWSDGSYNQLDFYRYTMFSDTNQYYTKRSTCTCTEVFKWRGFRPIHDDEIFDLEFSDGYKFSSMAYTRLFMYNPQHVNEGAPYGAIPNSSLWPHSLRAVTPHELYHYTGSAYVLPGVASSSVATYELNPERAFIKCADIIPGTTRTNGYVYLKKITRRIVRLEGPVHRNRYNSGLQDDKFNMVTPLLGTLNTTCSQGSHLESYAYAATTAYPRNHFGAQYSSSIIYDGMLMLENGLYVGFEGPNCWSYDEYNLEARNPRNRTQGDCHDPDNGQYYGIKMYRNPLGFPMGSQRNT